MGSAVGGLTAANDAHILILRTCDCHLTRQMSFADVITTKGPERNVKTGGGSDTDDSEAGKRATDLGKWAASEAGHTGIRRMQP